MRSSLPAQKRCRGRDKIELGSVAGRASDRSRLYRGRRPWRHELGGCFHSWDAIADSTQPRLAKGVRLQIDSATGKNVLLFPEGIVELNETAHEILSRCDGRTFSEIVHSLAEEYDANAAALGADVRATLSDLHRRKLIELT